MKFTAKDILYIFVIIIIILLYFDSCSSKKDLEKEVTAYVAYQDTAMSYKDKNGKLISYNTSLQMSEENLLRMNDELAGDLKRLKLKKPSNITKITTETVIDTFIVEHTEKIPCDTFTLIQFVDSTHYKINYTLTETAMKFNSILIPNKQQIIVAEKKNGMFKKNEYSVVVENSNPYMMVTGVQNYNIKVETPIYQRWYVTAGAGFISGFFVSRELYRR